MKFIDFVTDFNKKIFSHSEVTKNLAKIVDWICKNKIIQEINLEDGKEHTVFLNVPNIEEEVKCYFGTEIGLRVAEFYITGLSTKFGDDNLKSDNLLVVRFNLYNIENYAFNGWELRQKVEVAKICCDGGKFYNCIHFFMKSHHSNKGILDGIHVFAEGKNQENRYQLFSSKDKIFKDVKFSFKMDPWCEIYNMNREKEIAKQKENYKNFGMLQTENKKSEQSSQSQQSEKSNSKTETKDDYQNEQKDRNDNYQSYTGENQEAPRAEDHFTGKDYYKMLGVKQTATTQEIRKAYREIISKIHPDISGEYYLAEVAKKINSIKDVLLDPERRKNYDMYLRDGCEGRERV